MRGGLHFNRGQEGGQPTDLGMSGPMQMDPQFEQGFSPDGMPMTDLGGPMPGGSFPGMVSPYPEPTTYLKDRLRYDDYLDRLGHELRGDTPGKDPRTGEDVWIPNPFKIGQLGGPMLNDAGIQIIKSKLAMVLNKFATHANLSDEEIHGYTFEGSIECLMWLMIEGDHYQVQEWARHQIINLIDSNTYFNLSTALGGGESTRIAGLYQAKDINPGYQQRTPGFFEGLMRPFK